MQLDEFVLRGIAFGRGLRFTLLQREQIIRLCRDDDGIGLELANHVRHRSPVGNPPAIQSSAGQLQRLGFDPGQTAAVLQRIYRLRCHPIEKLDNDLIGHHPALVGRRNAAGAASR